MHHHQIRLGQRKSALDVILKFGLDDDVVGAGGVIDPEGRVAAMAGDQIGEGVVRAFGLGNRLPAVFGRGFGVRHENTVVPAVADGNVVKLIVAAFTHEDAQVVGGQNGVADDVVIESQIQRNAGAGIVVEVKFREQAIFRPVAGQAVELVVKRGQIPHRQPPHAQRGHQAPGTAAGASHMFHRRIAHTLNRDSIVADLRAFARKPPEFALLMGTVSVNKKGTDVQIFDSCLGIVDGLAQDEHRAIDAIRQAQDRRVPGTAQGLMIALQHDGLADFKNSGWQHHFPATLRQNIQSLLDFGAGHAQRQSHDLRFQVGYLGSNRAGSGENRQKHAHSAFRDLQPPDLFQAHLHKRGTVLTNPCPHFNVTHFKQDFSQYIVVFNIFKNCTNRKVGDV